MFISYTYTGTLLNSQLILTGTLLIYVSLLYLIVLNKLKEVLYHCITSLSHTPIHTTYRIYNVCIYVGLLTFSPAFPYLTILYR